VSQCTKALGPICPLNLASMADAEAGPLSIPEEDYAVPRHHIRHPDEVPLVLVALIQGVLNLLPDIRGLIDHELLGVVSSVLLLWHGLFPFPRLLMFIVNSSLVLVNVVVPKRALAAFRGVNADDSISMAVLACLEKPFGS
jgi:hypothetical protein